MIINDNGVEREMTESEEIIFSEWAKLAQAEDEALAKAKADKAAARQTLLDRLGITSDEATLLIS